MKKQYKIQLPKGKKVTMTNVDFENGVMTVNVELENRNEKKYEPKDGDFIYLKWKGIKTLLPYEEEEKKAIGIFKEIKNNMLYCYITFLIGEYFKKCPIFMLLSDNDGDKISNGYISMFDKIRPATEREKKILIYQLAKVNKKWNEETRTIENVRWRADYGGTYYFVDKFIKASPHNDCRFGDNNFDYTSGNYFKTKKAAEKAAEQIREIFKNSKSE